MAAAPQEYAVRRTALEFRGVARHEAGMGALQKRNAAQRATQETVN